MPMPIVKIDLSHPPFTIDITLILISVEISLDSSSKFKMFNVYF